MLVLVGVGGAFALKLGPFAASPTPITALPSFPPLPSISIPPVPSFSIPPLPSFNVPSIVVPTFNIPTAGPTTPPPSGEPTAPPVTLPPVSFSLPPLPSGFPSFSIPPLPSGFPSFSIPPLPSGFPSFSIPPIPSFSIPPIPGGSFTPEQQALLDHVPTDLKGLCQVSSFPVPGNTAAIVCTKIDTSVTTVQYMQFSDAGTMGTAYQGFVTSLGATTDSGPCGTTSGDPAPTWPQENAYTIGEQDAGRLVCGHLGGLPEIAWTDDRFNILTFAIRVTDDQVGLYEFWKAAGPE